MDLGFMIFVVPLKYQSRGQRPSKPQWIFHSLRLSLLAFAFPKSSILARLFEKFGQVLMLPSDASGVEKVLTRIISPVQKRAACMA